MSETWTQHWIYWAAPLSAAFVVGALYKIIFLTMPLSPSEAEEIGVALGSSTATLQGGKYHHSGARYLTAADAITARAMDQEVVEVVVDGQRG